MYCQWTSAWPAPAHTPSLTRGESSAQIYILKHFHILEILYTEKAGMESAFTGLGSHLLQNHESKFTFTSMHRAQNGWDT